VFNTREYLQNVDMWLLGVTLFGIVAGEFPSVLMEESTPAFCIGVRIHNLMNHPGLAHVSMNARSHRQKHQPLTNDPAKPLSSDKLDA
jgi:hypothetical protein